MAINVSHDKLAECGAPRADRVARGAGGIAWQRRRNHDHAIDFSRSIGDEPLDLTPKEFELLQYMVAHPNVPITHTKLLQSVWGPDYGDEVEYLRVFVNQLRKKIEKNPSNPKYLVTEPWVGYCFRLPG